MRCFIWNFNHCWKFASLCHHPVSLLYVTFFSAHPDVCSVELLHSQWQESSLHKHTVRIMQLWIKKLSSNRAASLPKLGIQPGAHKITSRLRWNRTCSASSESVPAFSSCLSGHAQLTIPDIVPLCWQRDGGRRHIMKSCNALMSCHAIRRRQVINLDHLLWYQWKLVLLCPHSVICMSPGCRYEEMEDRKRLRRGMMKWDEGLGLGLRMLTSPGMLVFWEGSVFL